ncbi:MAG: response regulator [Steroidobacteraceae bacterium]
MPTVLAIDDEPHVLRSLARELRGQPFELLTESDPQRALERLRRTDGGAELDVVLCDCRMPQLDGLQLLAELHRLHPRTVTILMSGHADMQDVLESVTAADIFRFISKPWDPPELRAALLDALAQRRRLVENHSVAGRVHA